MSKRVVLTVSGVIAADIREQIASGKRPRADYLELARGFNAELLDHAAAREAAPLAVQPVVHENLPDGSRVRQASFCRACLR